MENKIKSQVLDFPKNKFGVKSTIDFHLNLLYSLSKSSPLHLNDFLKINKNNYRKEYPSVFFDLMVSSLKSTKSALKIAENGLNFIKESLKITDSNGREIPLNTEMNDNKENPFETVIKTGKCKDTKRVFRIKSKGGYKSDINLSRCVEEMRMEEQMEPDAASALHSLALTSKSFEAESLLNGNKIINLEKIKDHVFILIGAGSAMCPFESLADLGATIVAIDICSDKIWERLFEKISESSGARMIYPVNKEKKPGCNLLSNPAGILNWLISLEKYFKGKEITIGNYTYLDGARHVLLSASSDAVIEGFQRHFNNIKTNVAFLCTPTDVSPVPMSVLYSSNEKYNSYHLGSLAETLIHLLSFKTQLRKNEIQVVEKDAIYNGLVVAQGPNYALAKTIQMWRAVVHYCDKSSGKVSLNVAPATATQSVVHIKKFKWAFEGMPYFYPVKIFEPETSSSLMAGLLLSDVLNDEEKDKSINPVRLKGKKAIHGGAWRCPYSQDSLGFSAVLVHFLGGPENFALNSILFLSIPVFLWSLFNINFK